MRACMQASFKVVKLAKMRAMIVKQRISMFTIRTFDAPGQVRQPVARSYKKSQV